jgi:hypothetical protein
MAQASPGFNPSRCFCSLRKLFLNNGLLIVGSGLNGRFPFNEYALAGAFVANGRAPGLVRENRATKAG